MIDIRQTINDEIGNAFVDGYDFAMASQILNDLADIIEADTQSRIADTYDDASNINKPAMAAKAAAARQLASDLQAGVANPHKKAKS